MTKNNSVLIASIPGDIHAACVMLAARELGHKADLLLAGDIPERSRLSIDLSGKTLPNAVVEHLDGINLLSEYGTLWYRRWSSPRISSKWLHPADLDMAINESKEHAKTFFCLAEMATICVNGFRETMYAEIKLNQLFSAAKAGLRLPRTLLSNDPDRIRKFISNLPDGSRAIYKPYQSPIWQSDDKVAFGYTSLVTQDDLPSDHILQLTPGIFQEYVDKRYELRIIWLNGMTIAVKIESQNLPNSRIDWRAAQNDPRINLTKVDLPSEVVDKCATLMKDLSLLFGCIDMIYTDHGEYVFLEVNSMGQFLWIENINPEIELLDAFVQFILDPVNFFGSYENIGLNYGEFAPAASIYLRNLQESREGHLTSKFVYNE